jgi:formiminotetrahydrofolate cyclodeaminase
MEEDPLQNLIGLSTADLLNEFATWNAPPTAGSAAALTGALAAALVEKVAGLTLEKASAGAERLRARYGPYAVRASEIAAEARTLRAELEAGVQEDAEAVLPLLRAPGQIEDREARELRRQAPLLAATDVLLHTAQLALQVATLADELRVHGYQPATSDAQVAMLLAATVAEGALVLLQDNLPRLQSQHGSADAAVEGRDTRYRELLVQFAELRGGGPPRLPDDAPAA